MGRKEDSLAVLWSGAHTKREVGVWWEVANRTAELGGDDRDATTNQLLYCYSQILRLDTSDFDARKGRLGIYVEQNYQGKSVRECSALLKLRPNDLDTLQLLAELCIRGNDVPQARKAYEIAIRGFQRDEAFGPTGSFTLSDLNIYLELFSHAKAWADGILALKNVARWLCGRLDDTVWIHYQQDDREWDIHDEPRRNQIPSFKPGAYPFEAYGDGLPPEIRAKFGIFRLHHGPSHYAEAMRHFDIFDPEDKSDDAPVLDYPDLFRDIAENLFSHRRFHDTVRFYKAVLDSQQDLDEAALTRMGKAYHETEQLDEAAECFRKVITSDENSVGARIELAKIYEKQGLSALAFEQVGHVMKLGRSDAVRQAKFNMKRLAGSRGLAPALARRHSSASDVDRHQDKDKERDPDYEEVPEGSDTEEEDNDGDAVEEEGDEAQQGAFVPTVGGLVAKRTPRRLYKKTISAKKVARELRGESLKSLFDQMQKLRPAMRLADKQATADWMAAAERMVEEFRNHKIFFPSDRYIRFLGYSTEARKRALNMKPKGAQSEVDMIAERLKTTLNAVAESVEEEPAVEDYVPIEFHGISFDDWLDVFCELALQHAKADNVLRCYELLDAAASVNVFYHEPARLSHVHVVAFTCAAALQDEEKLCSVARWFVKAAPQATEPYRLFAALNRLYHGESSWYSAGPTQKFVLRAIKAIDFALLRPDQRARFPFTSLERSSYRHLAGNAALPPGAPGRIDTLDPALLTIYGNILATSGAYQNALNYYLRAYAAQPRNPLVLLSTAIAYLQHALKRQCENRHYHLLQGLAFLREYQRCRRQSGGARCNRLSSNARANRDMELEFNEGRAWHQLGLMHLAVPAYERCLAVEVRPRSPAVTHKSTTDDYEGQGNAPGLARPRPNDNDDFDDVNDECLEPDFKREAAYALQNIYAVGGDLKVARAIGEKWLVF